MISSLKRSRILKKENKLNKIKEVRWITKEFKREV